MFASNRREILEGGGALLTLLALGGCEKIKQQIANRPVRKDVSTLANNDPILEAYRDAISQMQGLGSGDPRNWNAQASIHNNFCPHGNWFFLPWHRGYLLAFESIIRKLSGNAGFALPYWNWTCQRAVPAPFWESGSVLNHSPRAITSTSQADIGIVGAANINAIMAQTNFETFASGFATALRGGGGFTGQLEGGPHNYIHGTFIRGTMATYLSPLDPIFWLHHCNLDRLWFDWNSAGNANSNDPTYVNQSLAGMFVNGDGQPVTYQVGALILAPLISYRYEAPGGCIRNFKRLDDVALKALLQKGSAVRFRPLGELGTAATNVRLTSIRGGTTRIAVPAAATKAALDRSATTRLVLKLDDVKPEGAGDYFVRVFVNLPAGQPATFESDHYAGAFAFFIDPRHQHGPLNYVVDLSETVARLTAKGGLTAGQPLDVSLVVVPAEEAQGAAVRPAALSIGAVSPILIARESELQTPR